MTENINKIFKNKTVSSKIKLRIRNLGDKILKSTLKEINLFINKK